MMARAALVATLAAGPAAPAPSFEEAARRAALAREAGRGAEAVEHYRQALELRPAWDEGWWYAATVLYESDRYAEAGAAFARFLELKPDVGAAWVLRGLCDFRVAEYAAAHAHIDKGLALGVGGNAEILAVARHHQALLLVREGQFERAVPLLTLLARAGSETPELADAIGLMMLRTAALPAEVPERRRALVRQAGHAGYLHLARRADEASTAFAGLVAAHPNEPWVNYAQGVFLLPADPDRALAALRRETEVQPDAVFAHLEIAFELLRRGNNAGARAAAERAVALAPGLFAAQNALGRALVELGDLEPGIAALEQAARLAPESPEMHYSLARAYAKAGRPDDAARERAIFSELEKMRREPSAGGPARPRRP
jgi:tetratricopeptide (TPR) repeat protein